MVFKLALQLGEDEDAIYRIRLLGFPARQTLKARSLEGILIAVVVCLRCFPKAVDPVFPQGHIQGCIVYRIRKSLLRLMPLRTDHGDCISRLRQRCGGTNVNMRFRSAPASESKFDHLLNNALECLHMRLRKSVKNRGLVRSDVAKTKLPYLALRNIEKDWKMPQRAWKMAANKFAHPIEETFCQRD